MHGHATPNFMLQESDLILCVGSRFDDRTVGNLKEYAPVARAASQKGTGGFVHVDVRSGENGKTVKPDFFVHAYGTHAGPGCLL